MSEVSDDVKVLINKIIEKYNLKPMSEITYGPGSEIGDGFMSRTYAVDINDSDKEAIYLFLKCAIDAKIPLSGGANDVYDNEIHFYEVIIPTYMEFLKEKVVEDGFRNIPKCYGSVPKKILVLENLKKAGYELCDKKLVSNEQHIELVFRTYAKFHAISFAYKDQRREEFENLTVNTIDFFGNMLDDFNKKGLGELAINDFIKNLNPVKDKFILDQSQYLKDKLMQYQEVIFKPKEVYNSIITQGDCWCNNMMFKYEDNNPSDVMLIDWQAIRLDTPVLDLSYFFYTSAASSKQTLRRVEDFQEIYHEELSKQIRKMGSNPDVLYPLPVFKKEWQKYAKTGFIMAFFMLRMMLGEKEDAPNFEGKDVMDALKDSSSVPVHGHQEEYINRLRNLARHFLLYEFL